MKNKRQKKLERAHILFPEGTKDRITKVAGRQKISQFTVEATLEKLDKVTK